MNSREQSFENKKIEPINHSLKNNEGATFSLLENEEGIVRIVLERKDGGIFDFNKFLPEGYRITGNIEREKRNKKTDSVEMEGTYADIPNKEVVVSEKDMREEGWRYILILLHEIGHTVRAEEKPEEVNELLELYSSQPESFQNEESLERVHKLTSADERDAWAFAIKNFRQVVAQLDLPQWFLFADREELMEYVKQHLYTYKEAAERDVKFIKISDQEKEKLSEEISKLYVKENKRTH